VRVLILGAGGMLGRDVSRLAGEDAIALTRAQLDVTDAGAVVDAVTAARPDVVVNCAAYTDVDGAEDERERALLVNGEGAGNVAAAAPRVVHVSTDYVFDGAKREPYVESDAVGPIGEYGRSKLAGERAVAAANPNHVIARTAWLFGLAGRNFVDTMLRVGAERGEAKVVDDQIGCPTYTGHLAAALLELAASGATGTFHVAGGGRCSWHAFAGAIFERAGLDVALTPCTTDEFPRPAPRPAWSVLASERVETPTLPAWQDGLDAYLSERSAQT
jgi:dTDP-4-dehydrorhamnose reductase